MRDAKSGRWLPGFNGEDDGRHVFSKAERQKGFRVLCERVATGKLPSRVAASVRSKIRRFFVSKRGG
jgi:hypothetical protein